MDPKSLSSLYNYNAYANELLFQTITPLSDHQLDQESSPSLENVRTLLIHTFAVEKFFLYTCLDSPYKLDPDEYQNINELISQWKSLAKEQIHFIDSQGPDDLLRDVEIKIRQHKFCLPAWQLLTQALVHSIHHRGELSIVLSKLGHPLPTMDPILLFVRQSGQEWPWE